MKSNIARFSLVMLLIWPSLSFSHAEVYPKTSPVGSWEKYVLRVPNERGVPTLSVELTFPEKLKVMSFQEVSGWKLTVHRDSAGLPIAAEWSGTLAADRFVEFPFVAVNPDSPCVITWPTTQEYSGGELVHWTGADTSETPVSSTMIAARQETVTDTPRTVSEDVEDENESCDFCHKIISWVAIGLAVVALVVAVWSRRPKSDSK
ncbi:MAG: DUF1775 domain-containing protein [Candidatus Zixiibacteriota bacterium]